MQYPAVGLQGGTPNKVNMLRISLQRARAPGWLKWQNGHGQAMAASVSGERDNCESCHCEGITPPICEAQLGTIA